MSAAKQEIEFVRLRLIAGAKVRIALSGGADSIALLDVIVSSMCKHRGKLDNLDAVYVNHGLSENADAWGEFCKEICVKLGVTFKQLHIDPSVYANKSIETVAREYRYKLLTEDPINFLLTAHHEDDNIETVFFRFLRGTGLNGLRGISKIVHYANYTIYRPFLNVSKKDILEHLKFKKLTYVTDESNMESVYTRNFIRNDLIPSTLSM